MTTQKREQRILVTGATGYIGGRLVAALEADGRNVRCLARQPERLNGRVGKEVEVVKGDMLEAASLATALKEVDTAYYLVHSLGTASDFESEEAQAAKNFAAAAAKAGVRRIIYLGGLCDERQSDLSPHLRSRCRVGEALRQHDVRCIEFRASVIIGSGSLSFELIRALVQRLPVMVTPRWVSVQAQPIAITDVIAYLVAALDLPGSDHRIYEIGGAHHVSYGGLMRSYAQLRGLRRFMITVPVLTPRLSSLWLNLVTPVYARIGRKLIDSMTSPSIVQDDRALRDFPIQPMGVREAIEQALRNEDREFVATHWADALSSVGATRNWGGVSFRNRIVDSRDITCAATPEAAFAVIQRIGGATGWYYGNILWQLRGFIDRMLGGVGMHRGRRDPDSLHVGDVLDCWRVEGFDPPHCLTLHAEMKLPGRAWLQFEVDADGDGSRIRQTALYDPIGWSGLCYWYVLYPVHVMMFRGMLRAVAKKAVQRK